MNMIAKDYVERLLHAFETLPNQRGEIDELIIFGFDTTSRYFVKHINHLFQEDLIDRINNEFKLTDKANQYLWKARYLGRLDEL